MCNNNVRITTRRFTPSHVTSEPSYLSHMGFDRTKEQLVRICFDELNHIGVSFPEHLQPGDKLTLMNKDDLSIELMCTSKGHYIFLHTPAASCTQCSDEFYLHDDTSMSLYDRLRFERLAEKLAHECMVTLAKHEKIFPFELKRNECKAVVDTAEQRVSVKLCSDGKYTFIRRKFNPDGSSIPETSAKFIIV